MKIFNVDDVVIYIGTLKPDNYSEYINTSFIVGKRYKISNISKYLNINIYLIIDEHNDPISIIHPTMENVFECISERRKRVIDAI